MEELDHIAINDSTVEQNEFHMRYDGVLKEFAREHPDMARLIHDRYFNNKTLESIGKEFGITSESAR